MFGKRLSQYLGFQKVILGLLAAVGLARLGLSLAGLPDATVAWLSMNVVAWAGALYYGVAVHTKGFGSYRQILPLAFFQTVLQQGIAVLGILLAIGGHSNIYAAPEIQLWRAEPMGSSRVPSDHRHHRPSLPAVGRGVPRHAGHEEGGATNRGGLAVPQGKRPPLYAPPMRR
jgi:hypothetical protein